MRSYLVLWSESWPRPLHIALEVLSATLMYSQALPRQMRIDAWRIMMEGMRAIIAKDQTKNCAQHS